MHKVLRDPVGRLRGGTHDGAQGRPGDGGEEAGGLGAVRLRLRRDWEGK